MMALKQFSSLCDLGQAESRWGAITKGDDESSSQNIQNIRASLVVQW